MDMGSEIKSREISFSMEASGGGFSFKMTICMRRIGKYFLDVRLSLL